MPVDNKKFDHKEKKNEDPVKCFSVLNSNLVKQYTRDYTYVTCICHPAFAHLPGPHQSGKRSANATYSI